MRKKQQILASLWKRRKDNLNNVELRKNETSGRDVEKIRNI